MHSVNFAKFDIYNFTGEKRNRKRLSARQKAIKEEQERQEKIEEENRRRLALRNDILMKYRR